jgi:heptosyltransferase-2
LQICLIASRHVVRVTPIMRENAMQRLLVIRGGAVGDFVVTLPVFGTLRRAYPQAWIEVLGNRSRAVLAHHPGYADRVTALENWDIYRLFSPHAVLSPALATYLRSFDAIVAYVPDREQTFTQNVRQFCPGEVVVWPPLPPGNAHITDHLLQAVAPRWAPPADPSPQVYIEATAAAAATQFWRTTGLPEQGVVAVHPGSGGRQKLWPVDGWQQVVRWIEQQGLAGLVISGPAEQDCEKRLWPNTHSPRWPCARQLPLPSLAACLARCQLVIGHDSGVAHLAAAVGTPTLTLFGPSNPYVWGPRSPRACILQPRVPQPLTLENLPPECVTQTLEALLRGTFPLPLGQVPCTIVPV